tara:strand:- start:13587 stop:15272 length:1686 start_codon:yes stop_codon:yes gene_type:complete
MKNFLKNKTFAWSMYDWANSAYSTSLMVAILPVYFVELFKNSYGDNVYILGLNFTGSSSWSLIIALSTTIVALTSPFIGAFADIRKLKRTLLFIYTLFGSLFTILMFFSAYTSSPWFFLSGCFFLSNIGYSGAIIWYNSFLPDIADRNMHDSISCKAYALGYLGGGLLLVIHLILIMAFMNSDYLDLITRICLASVGFWWFGFGIITLLVVDENKINIEKKINNGSILNLSFKKTINTLRNISHFKVLFIFLIAYLLFNDGIATVINIAGAYGPDVLGINTLTNMITIVLIQFIAIPGTLFTSRLANKYTAMFSLKVCLIGWALIILLAIGFIPIKPNSNPDFDYLLNSQENGQYKILKSLELTESYEDKKWGEINLKTDKSKKYSDLIQDDILNSEDIQDFKLNIQNNSSFSLRIVKNNINEDYIGIYHLANKTDGPLGWWPKFLRKYLWEAIGINVNMQWIILGCFVGIFLGGSQALARSIFSVMTPVSRSAEFFSFFGFIGRVSSVFGPLLFTLTTGFFDQRLGVFTILLLIFSGYILLFKIDVNEGQQTAIIEDKNI